MKQLRILYQDEHLVAVQKPAGMHVHPPEDPRHSIRDDDNCLKVLGRQLGKYLYPVHRLDRPTSGVLVFALDQQTASLLCGQFEERKVRKTYTVMARGWLASDEVIVHRPLTPSGPSETRFRQLGRLTAPWSNSRFQESRYCLLLAQPLTGRLHQIRRHLAGLGHPVIGDTQRGDGEHNRLVRQHWQIHRLWLHALELEFEQPALKIRSPFPPDWHRAFDSFGVCPL